MCFRYMNSVNNRRDLTEGSASRCHCCTVFFMVNTVRRILSDFLSNYLLFIFYCSLVLASDPQTPSISPNIIENLNIFHTFNCITERNFSWVSETVREHIILFLVLIHSKSKY